MTKASAAKRKPLAIVILGMLHFLAPIGNLFLNASLREIPFRRYLSLYFQSQNLIHNFPGLILPFIGGVLVLICTRVSFYLYLLTMTILAIQNYLAFQWHHQGTNPLIFASTIFVNVVIVSYFMRPGLRVFYLEQAMRFWETKPRFRQEIVAFVETPEKGDVPRKKIEVLLDNVSVTGAFVVSAHPLPAAGPVRLHFQYLEKEFAFPGWVVRYDEDAMGIGISFVHDSVSKKLIRELTNSFLEKGVRVDERENSSWRQFLRWVRDYIDGKLEKRPKD